MPRGFDAIYDESSPFTQEAKCGRDDKDTSVFFCNASDEYQIVLLSVIADFYGHHGDFTANDYLSTDRYNLLARPTDGIHKFAEIIVRFAADRAPSGFGAAEGL